MLIDYLKEKHGKMKLNSIKLNSMLCLNYHTSTLNYLNLSTDLLCLIKKKSKKLLKSESEDLKMKKIILFNSFKNLLKNIELTIDSITNSIIDKPLKTLPKMLLNMMMLLETLCLDFLNTECPEKWHMVISKLSLNSHGCSKLMMPMEMELSMIKKSCKDIKLKSLLFH